MIPFYFSDRVKIDGGEVVAHVRKYCKVALKRSPGSRHTPELGESLERFPFIKLRNYAKLYGGNEAAYMRLYRKVEARTIPHYRLKGMILIDPTEVELYFWKISRVCSMDEELDRLI